LSLKLAKMGEWLARGSMCLDCFTFIDFWFGAF